MNPSIGAEEGFLSIDWLVAESILNSHTSLSSSQGVHLLSLFLAYLIKSAREGHLCVSLEGEKPEPSLGAELDGLLCKGAALLDQAQLQEKVVASMGRYYLKRNWVIEQRFLEALSTFLSSKPSNLTVLNGVEQRLKDFGLEQEQKEAIRAVFNRGATFICGGPGTGKTYTAAKLIQVFLENLEGEVVVGAPTGKATANLRAGLGELSKVCQIKTLHALLQQERLFADLVIVDEASMIDAPLMARLFSSLKPGARLVLLGDHKQLPPVESGHLFTDLVTTFPHLCCFLTKCLRTDLIQIVDLAHKAQEGKRIPFLPLPDPSELVLRVLDESWTLLTPLRKGPFGVEQLNQRLKLEAEKRGIHKVPIMVCVNDPTLGLFNGDTGIWDRLSGQVFFSSGQSYPETLLPHYEIAFALSVHKSQGSEYDKVMLVLPEGSEEFGREMLYTGITRAKRELHIYSTETTMQKTCARVTKRVSGVCSVVIPPSLL